MNESFLTIKRTKLANVVVITAKRTALNLVTPYTTFTINGESRFATSISDHVTEAAAVHAHNGLVARVNQTMVRAALGSGERSSREERAHATDAGPQAV